MNTPILLIAAATVAGTLTAALRQPQPVAPAQQLEFPAASPLCTLKQRVGMTDIEVTYSRPSMRGRKIFGDLEPFGTVWRTGANQATQLSFSTDVTFGGAQVPAGTYALLSIPSDTGWTLILSSATDQFGTYAYDAKDDVVRAVAKTETLAAPVESLTIGLADLRSDSANLTIEWETTRVSVPIETGVVEVMVPMIQAAMEGDGPHPYFQAAMFYYDNDLDMQLAAKWIDEAVKAQPSAFWVSYRKGLILEKGGDLKGAIEAAKMSRDLAMKRSGALKAEYVRLNDALIARCSK